MIERLIDLIPTSVLSKSGSVFYSGRAAFADRSPLYILGLNPGGSPESQAPETVEWHTRKVVEDSPAEWSAYSDESWQGRRPGTYGLQPRVLHLLRSLEFDPRLVPSSNVVFVRSEREKTLNQSFSELAEETWPFHDLVIKELGVRIILCFGKTAGNWVARKVGATRHIADFVENNNRRWRSTAVANGDGLTVVTGTHPSIADWTALATDPTPLVRRALEHANNEAIVAR